MKLAGVRARWIPSPLLLLLLACGPSDRLPDAGHLPYDLVRVRHVWNGTAGDLDGDGEDEVIHWYAPGQMVPGRFMAVVLSRHTGAPIDQVNFDGLVREPLLRDLDGDGAPEILVPLIRNDSMFLSVLDRDGTKLRTLYMTSGRPRIEPEGAIPWDPILVNAFVADVDGVAGNELVSVIVTAYARLPRGVFVHALPDGRPIGEMIVGAGLTEGVLDDFDGDGRPELVVVSSAGNNGAVAGGFDDSKAYLLFFELTPEVRVVRSLELPVGWGYGRLGHGDFDGDGRRELLVTTALHASSGGRANFRILDAETWQLLRERDFDQPLASPILVDLDHDTRPEIVTLHARGELWVFDHRLEVTRTRALPGAPAWLTTAPDVDADGLDELIVHYDPQRALMLDRDLDPRATWDGGRIDAVVRRGFGEAPLLIVQTQEGDFVSRLDANPTYLVNRYAPAAAALLAGAIALVFTLSLLRLQRENRRLRAANAAAPIARLPACLVNARGRVRWTSPALRTLLPAATDRRAARRAPQLDALDHAVPGIAQAVRRRLGAGDNGAGERLAHAERGFTIEPAIVGDRGDPHWLIRIGDDGESGMAPRTWALMAQRVAHGLKNPLTSMLLTLRRLEMEYRERAPAVAGRLDRYSGRIEARIEELRRLTSNFLKFVNVEEPRLELADVNMLIREYGSNLERTLPPDIRLDVRPGSRMPHVRLDAEQLLAALDNLIANAVDAMPDGGLISLSTGVANGVQWSPTDAPADHVTIEVADTGTGIPDELKGRLFEPGWSGREDGSGLGLAIARKVMLDHGGRITYESEVGSGTSFTLFLPIARADVAQERMAVAGTSRGGRA